MVLPRRHAARHGLAWLLGLGTLLMTGACAPGAHAQADPNAALIRLLDQRSCKACRLQDVDLVHADLRDADLRGAQLQRANLSHARLDGADLSGTDLSFTSLAGASLRGADLRGARLIGTDLTRADLSGALLDAGTLSRSHWQQAVGISRQLHSYADMHNAGIRSALAGNHPEAERWLSSAIQRMPNSAVSWVARGLTRLELGKTQAAAQDLLYASNIYAAMGDTNQAETLRNASKQLLEPPKKAKRGNGLGTQVLSGIVSAIQTLAPLALKVITPTAF